MLEFKSKSACSGCGACQNICPRNAISMEEDEEGFLYPIVDSQLCINCGLCQKKCPIINKIEEAKTLPKAYAAYNKNEDIRLKSSSGGVFTEMAKEIIINDGVVFGAVFDKDFNVVHDKATEEQDLERIRGSKYIQSNIGDSYKNAKEYLDNGKKVLFTGTPCQIEGLYSFLNKDYDNLYTQDLICHGVPSKKIWRKYLEYRKKVDNDIPNNLSFRNKNNKGWSEYQVSFKYKDKIVNIDHKKDIYMKLFLSDVALRPSCYDCQFKKKNRISDITLADFWGINKVIPEMNDEKGTSLIILNSKKGEELFNKISSRIEYKSVDFEKAISNNPSMTQSPSKEKRKVELINDLDKVNLEQVFIKYIEK